MLSHHIHLYLQLNLHHIIRGASSTGYVKHLLKFKVIKGIDYLGGRLEKLSENWALITNDKIVLQIIRRDII